MIEETYKCVNCNKDIPKQNKVMHEIYCQKVPSLPKEEKKEIKEKKAPSLPKKEEENAIIDVLDISDDEIKEEQHEIILQKKKDIICKKCEVSIPEDQYSDHLLTHKYEEEYLKGLEQLEKDRKAAKELEQEDHYSDHLLTHKYEEEYLKGLEQLEKDRKVAKELEQEDLKQIKNFLARNSYNNPFNPKSNNITIKIDPSIEILLQQNSYGSSQTNSLQRESNNNNERNNANNKFIDTQLYKLVNELLIQPSKKIFNQILEIKGIDQNIMPDHINHSEIVSSNNSHHSDNERNEVIEVDNSLFINQLPEITIDANIKNNKETNECLICLKEFQLNQKVILLPCFHIFHKNCITSWIQKKKNCPLCKLDIENNIVNMD